MVTVLFLAFPWGKVSTKLTDEGLKIFSVNADYFIGETTANPPKTNDSVYDAKLKKLIILSSKTIGV